MINEYLVCWGKEGQEKEDKFILTSLKALFPAVVAGRENMLPNIDSETFEVNGTQLILHFDGLTK